MIVGGRNETISNHFYETAEVSYDNGSTFEFLPDLPSAMHQGCVMIVGNKERSDRAPSNFCDISIRHQFMEEIHLVLIELSQELIHLIRPLQLEATIDTPVDTPMKSTS